MANSRIGEGSIKGESETFCNDWSKEVLNTHIHTIGGVPQKDIGASWKSSQWSKLEEFDKIVLDYNSKYLQVHTHIGDGIKNHWKWYGNSPGRKIPNSLWSYSSILRILQVGNPTQLSPSKIWGVIRAAFLFEVLGGESFSLPLPTFRSHTYLESKQATLHLNILP